MTPLLQRWALGIEYDGSAFHGFQVQANRENTVQEGLQLALSRVAAHPVSVVCAGRTDAGVHATMQVVHFDTTANREPGAWVRGANALAPDALVVRWSQAVASDFHARFSARSRRYLYVLTSASTRLALARQHITRVRGELDIGAMHDAAQSLLGVHDFSAFRAAGCQARSPVREMYAFDVRREGQLVLFHVSANAFLQHMVRNLVGSLLRIGQGLERPDWMASLLAGRDRRQAGPAAPAAGLYLTAVRYDRNYGFDSAYTPPWFLGAGTETRKSSTP